MMKQQIKAPPEMRVLEAEIGTLTLEAGDILAVIFKELSAPEMADDVMRRIKHTLPTGVGVIIFTEDVKLAVIKPVLDDGPEYALGKRDE